MKKLLALVALFASCGAQAADTLHLYNWNNYLAPETVKKFEASCKCKVVESYYSDNEELLAKLAGGAKGYDLMVPTGYALESMTKQKLLKPLDKSALPNLKNINPQYLNTTFDKGNVYSVPYAYTTTVIGYNDAKIKELGLPTDTWALIFEPKYLAKIKGRVTVLDSQRELLSAALKYLGYSVNSADEKQLKQAQAVILKAKPYWASFNASSYIKELTIGNAWVVHGYSSDIYQAGLDAVAAKRPFKIVSATPKEGFTLSLDSFVMHKNAPRPDLALKFINFMLDGQNGAQLTNLMGSGNPNAAAIKFVRHELTQIPAIFPQPAALAKAEQLKDLDVKSRRLYSRLWSEIKVK